MQELKAIVQKLVTSHQDYAISIKGLERSLHEFKENLSKTNDKTSRNNSVHIPSPKCTQFLKTDVPQASTTPLLYHAHPNCDPGHKPAHTPPIDITTTGTTPPKLQPTATHSPLRHNPTLAHLEQLNHCRSPTQITNPKPTTPIDTKINSKPPHPPHNHSCWPNQHKSRHSTKEHYHVWNSTIKGRLPNL
jgi:hypothetical protein